MYYFASFALNYICKIILYYTGKSLILIAV